MKVAQRIYQAPACEAIKVEDDETEIYNGSGWAVAGFKDGRLVAIHKLLASTEENALQDAVAKVEEFKKAGYEIWTGCFSCFEFTEPEPLFDGREEAVAYAHLARLVGMAYAEL